MIGERLRDRFKLVRLAARIIAGRRYWIAPLLPLIWIGFQIFRLLVNWREESYTPADAQTVLMGFPLTVLAIGLGVRIIAGEIDRRTLEIAYTVPGGTHRVWLAKLTAGVILLVVAEALLALATFVFCTEFPWGALYGALQAAVFYMVLAMAMSALFKSEASGALATVIVLIVNMGVQGAGMRISPFWNPENLGNADPAQVLAWTVQNRIGMVLAIAAIAALAFARAENREKILSG
jgi:hypothetical protein